jgi:hypothetical protein
MISLGLLFAQIFWAKKAIKKPSFLRLGLQNLEIGFSG